MTTNQTRPARSYFPELNHAEVLHEQHGAGMPGWLTPLEEVSAWASTNKGLLADIRAEEAKVADLLCRKCRGNGRIIALTLVPVGECYSCNGSGWTAKGRRYAKTMGE
jgi:hypothetical protein